MNPHTAVTNAAHGLGRQLRPQAGSIWLAATAPTMIAKPARR
jgi:hypothetical protein